MTSYDINNKEIKIVYCENCGKETQIEYNENLLTNFKCICGGNLYWKIYSFFYKGNITESK